jgi:ABC-2 type transport system ATP-binding protein
VGFTGLADLLGSRFTVTETPERRMISIPAPGQTDELAAVTAAVRESGIDVDEIALRRPTLDDAFLALTGQPLEAGQDDDASAELEDTA